VAVFATALSLGAGAIFVSLTIRLGSALSFFVGATVSAVGLYAV
jgi:hypothetical protein